MTDFKIGDIVVMNNGYVGVIGSPTAFKVIVMGESFSADADTLKHAPENLKAQFVAGTVRDMDAEIARLSDARNALLKTLQKIN